MNFITECEHLKRIKTSKFIDLKDILHMKLAVRVVVGRKDGSPIDNLSGIRVLKRSIRPCMHDDTYYGQLRVPDTNCC
jgi:hypothetical protein